jgi:hypothetical protein
MSQFDDELKDLMRVYLATSGRKVLFEEKYPGAEPDVSPYAWMDFDAIDHVRGYSGVGCHWIVPNGSHVKEETYSQFVGTDYGNEDEVGLNVSGVNCACGKYKDVTIRVCASLGEAIRHLLGYDPTKEMTL